MYANMMNEAQSKFFYETPLPLYSTTFPSFTLTSPQSSIMMERVQVINLGVFRNTFSLLLPKKRKVWEMEDCLQKEQGNMTKGCF